MRFTFFPASERKKRKKEKKRLNHLAMILDEFPIFAIPYSFHLHFGESLIGKSKDCGKGRINI
jgi:hypothetical protein